MIHSPATKRMLKYLDHEHQVWTNLSGELATLDGHDLAEDTAVILARQRRQQHAIATIQTEYQLLLREWEASPEVTPEERLLIKAKTNDLRQMTSDLASAFAKLEEVARKTAGNIKSELANLQCARNATHHYQAGETDAPSHLDTNS